MLSYKKTLREQLKSPPVYFYIISLLLNLLVFFCVVLLSVLMFWVPWCDVRYDFRMKTVFDSSLPPVVCKRAHVLFTLFVFVCYSGVQHMLCCVFVLFFFVLCTLCCQFLWIVHFWLSPMFVHCVDSQM